MEEGGGGTTQSWKVGVFQNDVQFNGALDCVNAKADFPFGAFDCSLTGQTYIHTYIQTFNSHPPT